jgi:hypothetical protein
MKTKLAGFICMFLLFAKIHALADNSPATVNEKLLKEFQATFPLAESVEWNETGNHYFVHFKDHEILSEIEYDHEGNFIASKKYYASVDLLPVRLVWKLYKKFPDKNIFGVIETNTETETFYYVKMEDSKVWITVKCSSDGILAVVEKFNKQL